jgi:hypothetical protein
MVESGFPRPIILQSGLRGLIAEVKNEGVLNEFLVNHADEKMAGWMRQATDRGRGGASPCDVCERCQIEVEQAVPRFYGKEFSFFQVVLPDILLQIFSTFLGWEDIVAFDSAMTNPQHQANISLFAGADCSSRSTVVDALSRLWMD